jgi:hypothetical protein
MPAIVINQALGSHNNLYAPTFLSLHKMLPSQYNPLKTARPPKARVALELQSPAGRDVAAELAFIESWFEGAAMKVELERRKKQEEADEEAARQLNYKEHEVNGGLLEWYTVNEF